MVVSESGGMVHRLTANSQNLREYASSNQTSGIREPLGEMILQAKYEEIRMKEKLLGWIKIILQHIFSSVSKLLLRIKRMILSGAKYLIIAALVTGFLFNIGWMAESLSKVSSIKNNEAWLNFFGALVGAAIAVVGAYILSILNSKRERRERNQVAELIVKNFLKNEIDCNFIICGFDHVKSKYEQIGNRKQIQFEFHNDQIRFVEFDKVKYELIKYDSEIITFTLAVYDMFYRLSNKGDFAHFSIDEIEKYLGFFNDYKEKFGRN